MIARVTTLAFLGMEARRVEVQVQIAKGTSGFTLVGLPDKAINESKERVRAALSQLGLSLPFQRITVNLAPADLPKEGSHYDLPIALSLLSAMGVLDAESMSEVVALGELGLDAKLLPVPGVLPAARFAAERGLGLVCPEAQGGEALWAEALEVIAPPDLQALLNHFSGAQILGRPERAPLAPPPSVPDLSGIKGQESAKRALEVAAAGGHNLLMIGPPGAGKSLLAQALPGILPPLSPMEMLEVSTMASLCGQLEGGQLLTHRPYRAPHHSASMAALVGGGQRARPGEVSMAHGGVLFLDELPEFQRGVLDALRQPLETGHITVARAAAHVTYPARVQLIAAMNPCRCGWLSDAARACSRAPACGRDYQARVSGPLLDRLDISIDVRAVPPQALAVASTAESSAAVRARVVAARQRQHQRYSAQGILTNAEADGAVLEAATIRSSAAQELLLRYAEDKGLSARGFHRVLRLARTIADLAGQEEIQRLHMAEALALRGRSPGS